MLMWRTSANFLKRRSMRCSLKPEVDVRCGRLRDDASSERPHVDCATLRTLKNSIAEQHVSVKAAVIQPQLSRQAGDGDTDDDDLKSKSDETAVLFGQRLTVPL